MLAIGIFTRGRFNAAALFLILGLLQAPAYSQTVPVPRGNRILAMDVNLPETNDYKAAFDLAKTAGMNAVNLSFDWNAIETAPQRYENSFLNAANVFYPTYGADINLILRSVSTHQAPLPADLASYTFDHPLVISRYKALIDNVLSVVTTNRLKTVVVGVEVDGYLMNDDVRWSQYRAFYAAVSSHIRARRPGVKVTVEARLESLVHPILQPRFLQLHQHSDTIGVSYYHVNGDFSVRSASTLGASFAGLLTAFPGKTFHFYQLGFPSSSQLQSSTAAQANFVTEVFRVWDLHAARVPMITFTWMHDIPTALVNYYAIYYQYFPSPFLQFLATLGIRTGDGAGADKPAFAALKTATAARKW